MYKVELSITHWLRVYCLKQRNMMRGIRMMEEENAAGPHAALRRFFFIRQIMHILPIMFLGFIQTA